MWTFMNNFLFSAWYLWLKRHNLWDIRTLIFYYFFYLMFGFAFFPSLISLWKTLPYCFLMIIAFFPFKDFPYSSWQVNLAAIRSYLVNCRGGSLALEPAKYVSYSTSYKAHLLTRNDLTINHYNGIEYHN